MAKFKVRRICAGCYHATYGEEAAYIERSMDYPTMWASSCAECLFGRYDEARAYTEVVLKENAEYR